MILRLADFRFPDDPARLYPDNAGGDWVLEVGFGDGRFWAEQGKEEPNVNYLGVELSGVSLLKAWRRLQSVGFTNAHLTKMPAETLLRAAIPDRSLARIVVNFPDPWPKAGHQERRLLRRPVLELMASRLREKGEVWFTTDHADYFEFAVQEARGSGCFEVSFPPPPPAALNTKYAGKWRELGLDVRHVRLRAAKHPDVPHLRVETGDSVPHAIINMPPLDLSDFRKITPIAGADLTVVLLDAYRAARRDEWMVLAHVQEQDLTQEALIGVAARGDGTSLVRLERFGGVIVTPGLKAAVGAVTDLLATRGGAVLQRAY